MTTKTLALPTATPRAIPTWRYLGLIMATGAGSYAFNSITMVMPQLRDSLGGTDADAELVIAGYGIPFAILLILGGRLGDKFGRHRLFVIGSVVMLAASIACSFAPAMSALVAARVLQGVGAALATPQVLATIQATSTGSARVRAIAAFGAAGGIGSAMGQVVGGALAGAIVWGLDGWRITFWVVAAVLLLATLLSVASPRSRSHEQVDIDPAGVVLLSGGILSLTGALTFGPSHGWPWPLAVVIFAGLALLVMLWWHQKRIERSGRVALLPPSILRHRPLQLSLVATGLFFVGFGAILFVIPRALEEGLGVTPLSVGLAMLPFALVFTTFSLLLAPIQRRLGDATLLWGISIQATGLAWTLVIITVAWGSNVLWAVQPGLVLLGAGQALVFAPLTQLVVREIPDRAAGLSGGLIGTIQQLSLSLGVIIIGGVATAAHLRGRIELIVGIGFDLLVVVILASIAVRLTRRGRFPADE